MALPQRFSFSDVAWKRKSFWPLARWLRTR
jgi:hypothetical protein